MRIHLPGIQDESPSFDLEKQNRTAASRKRIRGAIPLGTPFINIIVIMGSFSVLGIIVAVGAVLAAYYMGYSSGRAVGRDEGFDEGKQEGSREGSMRAYAVGFDRGKRANAGSEEEDDSKVTSNLGIAIFAVILGLLFYVWLSSPKDADPRSGIADTIIVPSVHRSPSSTSPVPENLSLSD